MDKIPSQKPKEIWLISIAVGMIFLNFPFIQVFNTREFFLGVPTLVAFIFTAWLLLIFGLIIFSQILCQNSDEVKKDGEQRKDQS